MTANMHNQSRWVIALLFAVFNLSAFAQENRAPVVEEEELLSHEQEIEDIRRYSVEVIIFEYASSVSSGNEIFASKQPPPEPDIAELGDLPGTRSISGGNNDIIEYQDRRSQTGPGGHDGEPADAGETLVQDIELELIPALSSVDFRLLTPDEMTMAGIHQRLLDLDAYKPVLWGGWVQAVYEHETAPPVRLRMLGTPPLYIDGTLSLYLKNYLHLVVDITKELRVATLQPIYRQEKPRRGGFSGDKNTVYGSSDAEILLFQIKEDRIFNSGHLRYYDHPEFGLLATVNRFKEIPEQDSEQEPADEDSATDRSMLSNNN